MLEKTETEGALKIDNPETLATLIVGFTISTYHH
jgi:hypothetical protein